MPSERQMNRNSDGCTLISRTYRIKIFCKTGTPHALYLSAWLSIEGTGIQNLRNILNTFLILKLGII